MKTSFLVLIVLVGFVLASCKDDDVLDVKSPSVTLTSPVDDSNGVDVAPLFQWQATDPEGLPLTYDFYIGVDSVNLLVEAANLTSPEYKLSDYSLLKESKYYWQVIVNNGKERVRSEVWSFRSIPAPAPPVIIGPAEGEFIRDQLVFSWEAVPAGEGEKIYYEVYIGENASSLEKIGSVEGETTFSYDPSSLVVGKKYYWLVKASDLINASASELMSVKKLMVGAPDEPMMVAPIDKDGLYDANANLSWTAVPDPESDAVTYDVYVDNVYPPATLVAQDLTSPTFTLESLETNKPYYWQVVAKDPSNNYTNSVVSTFTKLGAGAPGAPALQNLEVDGMLSLDEIIKWDPVVEPDGQDVIYDVYVDNVYPPVKKVASDIVETEFQILNKDLSCDITDVKTFYCAVVAKDPDGNESNSVSLIFEPQMTGVFTDVRADEVEDYTWVRLGTQIWFSQGLRTKKYTDGADIPNIGAVKLTASKAINDAVLAECYWDEYDHHEVYSGGDWAQFAGRVYSYGCIYKDGFAPSGWHVCDKNDVNTLKSYTGADVYACTSSIHVTSEGNTGTDIYGLHWLSAGWRYPDHFRADGAFLDRALNWVDQEKAGPYFLELRLFNGEWRYATYNTKMMFGIRFVKNK